jgi:hypothetical protein
VPAVLTEAKQTETGDKTQVAAVAVEGAEDATATKEAQSTEPKKDLAAEILKKDLSKEVPTPEEEARTLQVIKSRAKDGDGWTGWPKIEGVSVKKYHFSSTRYEPIQQDWQSAVNGDGENWHRYGEPHIDAHDSLVHYRLLGVDPEDPNALAKAEIRYNELFHGRSCDKCDIAIKTFDNAYKWVQFLEHGGEILKDNHLKAQEPTRAEYDEVIREIWAHTTTRVRKPDGTFGLEHAGQKVHLRDTRIAEMSDNPTDPFYYYRFWGETPGDRKATDVGMKYAAYKQQHDDDPNVDPSYLKVLANTVKWVHFMEGGGYIEY